MSFLDDIADFLWHAYQRRYDPVVRTQRRVTAIRQIPTIWLVTASVIICVGGMFGACFEKSFLWVVITILGALASLYYLAKLHNE